MTTKDVEHINRTRTTHPPISTTLSSILTERQLSHNRTESRLGSSICARSIHVFCPPEGMTVYCLNHNVKYGTFYHQDVNVIADLIEGYLRDDCFDHLLDTFDGIDTTEAGYYHRLGPDEFVQWSWEQLLAIDPIDGTTLESLTMVKRAAAEDKIRKWMPNLYLTYLGLSWTTSQPFVTSKLPGILPITKNGKWRVPADNNWFRVSWASEQDQQPPHEQDFEGRLEHAIEHLIERLPDCAQGPVHGSINDFDDHLLAF